MNDFLKRLNLLKENFDIKLREILTFFKGSALFDCIEYAVFSGGKRIRPLFYLEALRAFGREITQSDYIVASAIELLHTYTLVHDDMPCMDNDDFRRGQPTVHKKYNEFTALLVGDALQAASVQLLTQVAGEGKEYVAAMRTFFEYAGVSGVIEGQALELRYNDKIPKNIIAIYEKKTAALLTAPLVMAADVSGKDEKLKNSLKHFGRAFGFAFQLSDDLLDYGKDKEVSFASLYGKERTLEEMNKHSLSALMLSKEIFGDFGFFSEISQYVAGRKF